MAACGEWHVAYGMVGVWHCPSIASRRSVGRTYGEGPDGVDGELVSLAVAHLCGVGGGWNGSGGGEGEKRRKKYREVPKQNFARWSLTLAVGAGGGWCTVAR